MNLPHGFNLRLRKTDNTWVLWWNIPYRGNPHVLEWQAVGVSKNPRELATLAQALINPHVIEQ